MGSYHISDLRTVTRSDIGVASAQRCAIRIIQ